MGIIIVEFKKLGAIYWFDIGYFNREVYKRRENLASEAKLRDWLFNYSNKKKRQDKMIFINIKSACHRLLITYS